MNIGIMGGTFDPVHYGHLMLAQYAYRQFRLDQVWFLPNGRPPHKSQDTIESETFHRARMVDLAIKDVPYFHMSSYELDQDHISYSYETMEYFHRKYPEDSFAFIIGADSLFAIESWKCPEKLLAVCDILAAYRDDKGTPEMTAQIKYLERKYKAEIQLLETPVMDVSSHEIRKKIKEGRSVTGLIPKAVEEYIVRHNLFKEEKDESAGNQ